MTLARSMVRIAAAAVCAAGPLVGAWATETVDMGQAVPDAKVVKEGLFPEDACKELVAAGYKCMGFKPAVRFSLPTANFKLGSAELPDLLRKQLDVFAEVLRGSKGSGRVVRIEGYADASGSPDFNQALSQKRADAVKDYLVAHGADQAMLDAVGRGSSNPKVASDPYAAANRRVEIGRESPP
jgi:OOP family OmpA-OmpF porin